ncbi:unnamed protein product, partial [Didymodactylos carnosus]
MRYLLPVT